MLKMFNLAKMLTIFIYLTSICCFFVTSQNVLSRDILPQNVSSLNTPPQDMSPQDIWYIYEEPIEGLKLHDTLTLKDGTLMIWMTLDDEEDPSCILPYFYLRLIERTGRITYINLNYTFPLEAVCPIDMTFIPLSYNYIMVIYVKSNNGVKGKYGLIINYDSEIISEIYLGDVNDDIIISGRLEKGFIRIEEYDKKGITAWHWFSAPDITTGKVVELESGEFSVPNLSSYTFVNSFNFNLIDGGFGYAYILKYDEMGSSVSNNPNIQYWKIYVSFLREGTYSPTTPSLVYQTTTKLNSLAFKSCFYNIAGYICIVSLNNTITNMDQSRTEVNYYQLEFLTTGSFVQFGMVPKEISNAEDFDLSSLVYGGFLVRKQYTNTTALNFYILDNNGNYKSKVSFGPEFFHYNMFRRNGTLVGIKKQTGNKLEILLKPLLRLNNQGVEYDNPAIESTKPAVNEVIDPLINEITIKYGIPVMLSTANVSIFQLNDDPHKPSLLRQTIAGDSELCTIGSDNHTVHIPIFSSTFNQPNSSYHVVVDNNFVISQERNEPLLGINEKTWIISTKPFKTGQHSVSVTGLLRLNDEGSSKFLQTNHQSEFFNNVIQEFSKIIPVNEQRITTNGKWQYDPTSPKKVLLSFTINEAKSAMEPSSKIIFDNLGTLIERKGFTALSNNEYSSLIDESASFTMTSYFGNFLPIIIIFLVSIIILTILYFLAHWKNPEARNIAIFETALIMQDFAVDLTFTLLRVNNAQHLIIPNMVFLVVPHVVNFLLAINILLSEVATNPTFYTWFSELPALLSICTIFSAINILGVNTLTSNLFGFKIFSAPLSQRSRNIILWGSFINIFAEDVPQLIIQILYFNSVVTYDLIPSLVLISGGLVIMYKLILRSYQALTRWCHRRDEIRNFIRDRRLSAGSIRSLRSNI